VAGRDGDDIASTYYRFLQQMRDLEYVIIFADNCMAQNKTWCLFTMLLQIVNSPAYRQKIITLKFLEKGHTFMSADSHHHKISRCMKNRKVVADFQDYTGKMKLTCNCK
jgi:hypothetical protein